MNPAAPFIAARNIQNSTQPGGGNITFDVIALSLQVVILILAIFVLVEQIKVYNKIRKK